MEEKKPASEEELDTKKKRKRLPSFTDSANRVARVFLVLSFHPIPSLRKSLFFLNIYFMRKTIKFSIA